MVIQVDKSVLYCVRGGPSYESVFYDRFIIHLPPFDVFRRGESRGSHVKNIKP